MWIIIRQYVIPAMFMIFFPILVIYLSLFARDGHLNAFTWKILLGTTNAWFLLFLYFLWAILFLKIPSKVYYGPTTVDGYNPPYQANGMLYYFSTLSVFLLVSANSSLPTFIFTQMPEIIASLNVFALAFCVYLWWRGKRNNNQENLPFLFAFYRGLELHPRIWGIDVKQFTNCRVGMMAWQLVILAYWIAVSRESGINLALTVNVLLQTIYIFKFFRWETGYFTTLDITLDRPGFYLCWGCLVYVPSFYAFSSYIVAARTPELSTTVAMFLTVLGIASILLNYLVDLEKQVFRESGGKRGLWGKKLTSIPATYTENCKGHSVTKTSYLLSSGLWGVSRHLNYVFELLLAGSWCACGWQLGIWPFFYVIFLTILLVHRIFRDEAKCAAKYGKAWTAYCQAVPDRLLPYIF